MTGVIADLLYNKRSIPYARAWRSDLNMWTISQLMLRLWVAEEARLGVSRPNGILQNLWQPLQSRARGSNDPPISANTIRRPPGADRPKFARRDGLQGMMSDLGTSWNDEGGGVESKSAAALTPRATDTISSSRPPKDEAGVDAPETSTMGEGIGEGPFAMLREITSVPRRDRTTSMVFQGRGWSKGRKAKPDCEASLGKAMEGMDLRGKIAAVLNLVGFDVDAAEGLRQSDLKASYMATSYLDFLEGEAWQKVGQPRVTDSGVAIPSTTHERGRRWAHLKPSSPPRQCSLFP